MPKFKGSCGCYSRDDAREIGIIPAIILNDMKDRAEHFDCNPMWYDQKQASERLAIEYKRLNRAVSKLVEFGKIKTKVGYRPDTLVKTTWVEILDDEETIGQNEIYDYPKMGILENPKMGISIYNDTYNDTYNAVSISEKENESEKMLDPLQEKNPSLEENRSEGAELNDRVPHSANVNSNQFGTAQENRSKGIEGYLSGLGKRMGLYSSYNLRNTAKLYRSAKSDMENNGIDFESFMKAVEENITLQDASPKENKVEIRRLDDVFKKWDKVADQLKASGVWSDVKLPSGWVLKENPGYRPTEYDRYLLYKDGLCERTRYRDGVIAFSDNDGHNFVYVKIILDVKKDGSAKFKGIKISKDPEEF